MVQGHGGDISVELQKKDLRLINIHIKRGLGPCTNRPIVFQLKIGKRKWNKDSLSVSTFFD